MAIGIYAGTSANGVTLLPSPTAIKPSLEIIWSEDTGRAQSGTSKAKMIGSVVSEKKTYSLQWGVLTESQLTQIEAKLKAGFFYFAVAPSLSVAQANAEKYYRSQLSYEILPAGSETYYKNVSVNVIQQ
jgi:hypothetical protein